MATYLQRAETAQKSGSTLLTPREIEVLTSIGWGFTDAEIAERLTIAEGTVTKYVMRLKEKLGIRRRIGLAFYAVQCGLVDLDAVLLHERSNA